MRTNNMTKGRFRIPALREDVRIIRRAACLVFLACGAFHIPAFGAETSAAGVNGRWDATLVRNGNAIPFRLDISGSGRSLKGTLYDGFQPYEQTTSASFEHGQLVLNIDHYLTTITATLNDGKLTGKVAAQSRDSSADYEFVAERHVSTATPSADVPWIAGSWEIPLETPSSKGEKAFRFIVEQRGADVAASILRVDGDTGAFSGTYSGGQWLLSHFDGSRPGVILVSVNPDGTLAIRQRLDRPAASAQTQAASQGSKPYPSDAVPDGRYAEALTAYRSEVARAKGLPKPENYDSHTTARDASERFTFNFPDVQGRAVSNDDPRFKGKVVLAIVTGTWCPNCHDEAKFLVELDKQYRSKGLAIVALDFEEPQQQKTLDRERAFVRQYGVKYTYLIAGAPSEMWEKVPQLVNLNTWPATLFVGRDGLIKGVHSGFASPASGEFNSELKAEFRAKIDQLLAQRVGSKAPGAAPLASVPGPRESGGY